MVGSGTELPAAVEDIAAVDRRCDALRRIGGGDPGVDVVCPDFLRNPGVGIGQLIGVHTHDAVHPACRRVQGCQCHHRLGEFPGVDLQPAVFDRLQHTDIAGRLHGLDRVVGELADLLGLPGLIAKLVGQVHHMIDDSCAHGVYRRRSCGGKGRSPGERVGCLGL